MPLASVRGTGALTYLFVHGTPGDHHMFDPLIARAPGDVRVAALDLPDHGAAPDEPALDSERLVRDVLEAARAVEGERVVLVGVSLGAYLAARAAAALGNRVERLVLFGGFAALTPEVAAARQQLVEQIESGQATLAQLAEVAVGMFVGRQHANDAAVGYVRGMLTGYEPGRMMRSLKRAAALAQAPAVEAFDTPATIVHARGDITVPYAFGLELAARARRRELVTLESDSHLPMWTHPEQSAQLTYQSV